MKPIAIEFKIPEHLKWMFQEEVEYFQEYCFENGVGWPEKELMHLDKEYFFVEKVDDNDIQIDWAHEIFLEDNCEFFTLPRDYDAFKKYFAEYLTFYTKKEPQIDEYWIDSITGKVMCIDCEATIPQGYVIALDSRGFDNLRHKKHFKCPATTDEIIKYETERIREVTKKAETIPAVKEESPKGKMVSENALIKEANERYKDGDELYYDRFPEWHCVFDSKQLEVDSHGDLLIGNNVIYSNRDNEWAEVREKEPEEDDKNLLNNSLYVRDLEYMVPYTVPPLLTSMDLKKVQEEYKPSYKDELTPEQINSACLSYRHDFGLMTEEQKEGVRFEAKEWLHAWKKEFNWAERERETRLKATIKQLIERLEAWEESRQDQIILNEAAIKAAEQLIK